MHTKYVSALAGGFIFYWIYGLKILDPENIAWMIKGDSATYFLGWHFFRQEEWTFPLGAIKSYQFPIGTSLIYTGSIPFLTIPLKLFSSYLPEIFQFHGIWILACYVLQGFFGALFLTRITDNKLIIILGSLFFILNPVLVQRSAYHLNMTSHWLILAGLYLYFGRYSASLNCKWIALLVAAVLINFYILAMLLVIWAAYLIKSWLEDRNVYGILICSSAVFISVLFSMWATGYFMLKPGHVVSGGFGLYSMNLISPFNPAPYDFFSFLKPAKIPYRQYEGFSYLGVGAFVLISFSLFAGRKGKMKFVPVISLPLIGAALILSALAISNKVELAGSVLFTIPLPVTVENALNSLRASGRLFWPVTYMIIFSSIFFLRNHFNSQKTSLIIFVALIIQVVDFYPWYNRVEDTTIDERIVKSHIWENLFPLKSTSWEKISDHTKQIIFIPPDRYEDEYVPFALLAANTNQTINVGYSARTDITKRNAYRNQLINEFLSGQLKDDALYVIMDPSLMQREFPSHQTGVIDDYLIVAPPIPLTDLMPWPHKFKEGEKNIISEVVRHYSQSNHIILMSVRDDASKNLPGNLREFIKDMGGAIEHLRYGGSYIAVINNGSLKKELLDNNKMVTLTTSISDFQINIASAGINVGNLSFIEINGVSVSPNKAGLNIVIINPEDGNTLIYNYDTFSKNWDYKLPEKVIKIKPINARINTNHP
ncbi:MAG: DUF6311 domain-containing protein [Nitrospinales bacterium]